MKRLFFTLVLATLATTLLNAQQNWFDKYKKLLNSNDTVALKKCIMQWEKANPESPDVIAAWYNYYIKRAMNNVLQLSTVQPANGKQYMELQNDTTKQTAGYLYEQTVYNPELTKQAFAKIDEGIQKFPNRLDLPFGKVYVLLQQEKYDTALNELKKVIERLKTNHNQWLWTQNKPLENPKEFLIDTMQGYFNQFIAAQDKQPAYQLNEAMLTLYPEDIRLRSNKASLLAIGGKYFEALPLFASIHKDAPEDDLVTYNLAYCYEKTGDKKTAIVYYRQIANSKDPDIAATSKQALHELKGR